MGGWKEAIDRIGGTKPLFDNLIACGFNRDRRYEACLYVVHVPGFGTAEGAVKIGKSKSPLLRWVTITSNWPEIRPVRPLAFIYGAQDHELRVHACLRDARLWGEWFRYTSLVDDFSTCKSAEDVVNWCRAREAA